jgi:hypothetical protein
MKKIFTALCVLCVAMTAQASLHLTIDQWVEDDQVSIAITKDTTIVVTEFKYDEDMDEATMEVRGKMYSDDSDSIWVKVTRSTDGIIDQLCAANNCVPGNGAKTQELEFKIGTLDSERTWFAHYTAQVVGVETIVYTFSDGVNPSVTLTVEYNYAGTAVENVVVDGTKGMIYNLLGQRMSANDLSELPKGIYIINGKKYIKQ